MQVVASDGRIPIKIWAEGLEDGAWNQALNLAQLPFAFHHVALMPDAHQGYGMPIGGVLATRKVVIPNAVGVDIGCGMHTFRTGMMIYEWPTYGPTIMHNIQALIPTGFKHHDRPQPDWRTDINVDLYPVLSREYEKSLRSLGTLGGGNHFIEAQVDEDNQVWFMIHSGSRNLGKQICDHYNKEALDLNERYYSKVEKSWQLSFLPLDHELGDAYMREQRAALRFALANRMAMAKLIKEELLDLGWSTYEELDVHHNYAQMEHHFGQNVLVHRKGAVKALLGEPVIIPGTMGTKSYIGTGLGSGDSFNSCSHGAGRAMGRNASKKDPLVRESLNKMISEGVQIYTEGDPVDESPGAYKDIDAVMSYQEDLVKIERTLRPLAVIKA